MLEKFRNIFEGLDYAYGAFVKQATNLPEAKTKGKSFVIKKAVTDTIWQKHLDGKEPRLGIFPVTARNLCKWACIDIDVYTYDYKSLLKKNVTIYVYNPKSLLSEVLPIFNFKKL